MSKTFIVSGLWLLSLPGFVVGVVLSFLLSCIVDGFTWEANFRDNILGTVEEEWDDEE